MMKTKDVEFVLKRNSKLLVLAHCTRLLFHLPSLLPSFFKSFFLLFTLLKLSPKVVFLSHSSFPSLFGKKQIVLQE